MVVVPTKVPVVIHEGINILLFGSFGHCEVSLRIRARRCMLRLLISNLSDEAIKLSCTHVRLTSVVAAAAVAAMDRRFRKAVDCFMVGVS